MMSNGYVVKSNANGVISNANGVMSDAHGVMSNVTLGLKHATHLLVAFVIPTPVSNGYDE